MNRFTKVGSQLPTYLGPVSSSKVLIFMFL